MSTTPLVRPAQSQVSIEPTAKNPLSDGFNYPQFRLLNKKARISVSKAYEATPETNYHLLAIANSRGWFAAARFDGSSYEIVLSPVSDLRSALKEAKEDSDNDFSPKRRIALPQGKPNILTFANHDTSLLVGIEGGSVLSFNSSTILSPGEGPVQPEHTVQLQSAPLRQILPNPGTEPNLVDKVAIVGNGTIQVFNTKLEPQGGWTASDADTNPMAVAWSPKGKHIAIGLKSGDILTYALTNMTAPHKHIPPTFQGTLMSLSWTGPGHTFRTSYTDPQDSSNLTLHVVSIDTKTSTGVYYSLTHPFASGDRTFQSPYTVQLPKWDEDAGTADHSKSLVVYGDATSVDIEILAHEGHSWYQQSQENPVSLPLNKDDEDTMMLSMDADLTDTSLSTPTIYVYLNDGTIQGWYLEHSKPYPLMVTGTVPAPPAIQSDTSMAAESPVKPTTTSPFGATSTSTSAFGQPSFGQPAFGSTGFGQAPKPAAAPTTGGFASFAGSTTAFGAGATTSAFGSQATITSSPFGSQNTSSPFGSQPSTAATTSPFGNAGTTSTSAFGSTGTSGFGSFANTGNSGFGSGTSAFSSLANSTSTTNVFGGSSFGASNNNNAAASPPSVFGGAAPASDMTREASMADDTPSFGGLSLGSSNTTSNSSKPSAGGMFGSFGNSNNSTTGSAFGNTTGGGILKPATGFGAAFGANPDSPFSKPSAPAVSAFGASATPATSAFAKPATAPAFGQTGFGTSSAAPATSTFGKPASAPAFGQTGFGTSAFGQPSFGQPAFGQSAFGTKAAAPATSAFGSNASAAGGFGAWASKPVSLTDVKTETKDETPQAAVTTEKKEEAPKSTFGGGGFSAFAGKPSSFGSTVQPEKKEEPKSVFGGGFSAFAGQPSAFGSSAEKKEEAPKSVFGNGGFSAFVGQPSAFGSSSQQEKKEETAKSPFEKPKEPSTPAKPTPAGLTSPPSSPEPVPSSPPFGSKESTPAVAFGTTQPPKTPPSFGTSSSSVLRPATGFGAFGSTTPESSPFFKKDDKPPTTSAFALSGTPSTPPSVFGQKPAATTTPAFGSPSALGSKPMFGATSALGSTPAFGAPSPLGGKSPFGTVNAGSSPTPASTTKPTTGGFGAFSSGPTAFSAFAAGSAKSFSDVLKEKGSADEAKESDKEKAKEVKTGKVEETTASPPPAKADKHVFTFPKVKDESTTKDEGKTEEKEDVKKEEDRGEKAEDTESEGGTDKPLLSPSIVEILSASSSYVNIAEEEGIEDDRSDDYVSDEEEEDEDYVPSSGDESDEEEGSEGESEEELSPPGSPTATSPKKEVERSSSTPQPEVPDVKVTPAESTVSEKGKERAASTTPPDTPEKEVMRKSPSPSPSSPFGIGLGRPSTRPVRSSPLAGTPLSSDDGQEDEDETKKLTPPLPSKEEPSKESAEPATKRPKTPPLLSTFSAPASISVPPTPVLAPAVVPPRPASTSDTAAKAESPSPASVFSKPLFGNTQPSPFGTFGAAAPTAQPSSFATPPSSKEATPFGLPSFSLKPTSSPTPPAAPGSLFGSTGAFGAKPASPAPSSAPASSTFGSTGFFGTKPSLPAPSTAPASTPSALSSTGFFGAQPTPPAAGSTSLFGSTGAFGTKPAPTAVPAAGQATPSPFGASPFGSAFKSTPQPAPATPSAFGAPAPKSAPPPPELTMEEGMQKECALLIMSIDKELAELRKRAQQVNQKREEFGKSAGGSWQKADLGDKSKWALGDLKQFGQVMLKLGEDLDELEKQREEVKQAVRELRSSMLKANTRREEIIRFNKAQNDADFAKMLKMRSLGPEHSESQTHLRKTVRNVRDRITKLESHLQSSKKKLAQATTGKVSIKAPTLDIVNRTFRNIELAISQQADDVSQLVARAAKLNLEDQPSTPSTPARDARLPDPVRRQPYNVTPNVAAVTAAALNAERSAHRLKKALLSARKEPLLNVKVNSATPPPVAFTSTNTPAKKPPSEAAFGGPAVPIDLSGVVFTPPPPSTSSWSLPASDSTPSSPVPTGRRGATVPKKHSTVQLKKTPGTPPTTPPVPSFDWGPLPSFHNSPRTTLAASFTKIDTTKKA
ncbi:hypothetical protein CC1G_06299 [Coprinopsis cinerea okayama7|uniref:Nucleoporin Nup159/Nup146 N-terminal domain-containing protein n=1 Tax=Coprinopsis cinerea (strain Okayama-7 / 130 / ATCC MYA-4618 / FGSC 9003) TaxID=240176 RepID=A8NTF2_COPC7|nr:hypothetical protein CC1G_06299 [Coprinopsis cinerea okayama7\|eukprot:XP_001836214.2 hypothetical protein CC1G_06299 [Coprinopsis cinerea okayama7\